MSAIAELIRRTPMTCTKCGHVGAVASCDCWEKCSCGWWAERGEPCRNPDTARCSTKVKYGKYNRKTRRYEAQKAPPTDEGQRG